MNIATFWKRWPSTWGALIAWAWTYAFFREFIPYPQWMCLPLVMMSVAGCLGATVHGIAVIDEWLGEKKEEKKEVST
jgi:hypothetical protein